MTTENLQGGVTSSARQEFRNPAMIEAVYGGMNRQTAITELIDNAMDETPSRECTEIYVTFDQNSSTVVVENKNTLGMPEAKMQTYPLWGELHEDPTKRKQWGWGGKVAALFWLDRKKGSLEITSRPKNTSEVTKMSIVNWWSRLYQNETFPIQTDRSRYDPQGFTRFELKNTRDEIMPSPSQLVEIANELGLTYGRDIEAKRLKITLNRIDPKNHKVSTLNVIAINPPFDESNSDSKPTSIKGEHGVVRMELKWGLLDASQRSEDTRERAKIYGVDAAKLEICPGEVYIYNHEKLLQKVPWGELKILGISAAALHSLVATVNITHGWITMDLFKTGLSVAEKDKLEILKKVRAEVSIHAKELMKQSESTVSQNDRLRIQSMGKRFRETLLKMFDNNLDDIAQTLNIITSFTSSNADNTRSSTHSHNSVNASRNLPVPGQRNSNPEGKEKQIKPVKVMGNPIPAFEITDKFQIHYPAAELILREGGTPQILFNKRHPMVKTAIEAKNANSAPTFMNLAARVFYQRKWLLLESTNASKYEQGLEKDVADFLEASK